MLKFNVFKLVWLSPGAQGQQWEAAARALCRDLGRVHQASRRPQLMTAREEAGASLGASLRGA